MTTEESIAKLQKSNKRLADFLSQPHEVGLSTWWLMFAELAREVYFNLEHVVPKE